MANNDNNVQTNYQTPLITVSGELSDYLLNGNLATQINSDLSRESIDWQKNSYDVSPVSVYVEAYFVHLNEQKHLLWDMPKLHKHNNNNNNASNEINTNNTRIVRNNNNNNNNQTLLKRHHSFQNMITNAATNITSQNVRSLLSSTTTNTNSNLSINDSIKQQQQNNQQLNYIDYNQLFKLLSKRSILNNGARILLNSYWLDSNHDLESYNNKIRKSLIDWFQKILQTSSNQHKFGLNQDFNLDFFIVIVVRNCINNSNLNNNINSNINNSHNNNNNDKNKNNKLNTSLKKSQEQLLNLKNLINDKNSSILNNKTLNDVNKINSNSANSLSSSMSSLNDNNNNNNNNSRPIYLTHQQLADQIRNDLLVCFQLFRQNNLNNENNNNNNMINNTGIPPNNSRVAYQLIERIIIFDSTSNSSSNLSTISTNSNNIISNHTSSNPILSSTARTFSALSNFSTSSIKLTSPTSMISKSPTRTASRLSKTLLTGNSSSSSSLISSSIPLSSTSSSLSSATLTTSGIGSMLTTTAIFNYSQFIIKIRQFILEFYTKQFNCFEKLIRHIRELRNDSEWDYFGFFLLQEELAFAHESLGLYSKALIQYDELDALFSQLISNVSKNGGFGAPRWLRYRFMLNMMDDDSLIIENGNINKSEKWTGLCLCNQKSIMKLRMSIVESVLADIPSSSSSSSSHFIDPLGVETKSISHQISLLDFRNYLYARQCHLLCLLNKPWELASRALPFLQTAVAELNMLELLISPGGIACWVFLSVLEILHKCERYSDSSQLESYSYHTVGLWSYARDNLIELGKICNLMPDDNKLITKNETNDNNRSYSSQHLHKMVELVAGMGADPHIRPSNSTQNDDNNWMSPQERLKDALSSPESFLRHYLEITELTMGTYKHIGYIRYARSIGKQLAELNLKLNKPQQALPFLLDLYHMFQMENWSMLKLEACRLLAQCLEQLYFNIANTLTIEMNNNQQQSSCNNNNFNLEPIIRSSFRLYLMLLIKSEELSNKNNNYNNNNNDNYFKSMFRLLCHYEKRADKLLDILIKNSNETTTTTTTTTNNNNNEWLNQKLLIIHNSYSDLFNENSSTGSTSSTTSSIGGRSSSTRLSPINNERINNGSNNSLNSSSSSNSNKNNSLNDLNEINSNNNINNNNNNNKKKCDIKNNSNEFLSNTQQQCFNNNNNNNNDNRTYSHQLSSSSSSLLSLLNYNQQNFLTIESIEIDCDSSSINDPLNNNNNNNLTLMKKNDQSFIAGSILNLRIKIFNHLTIPLKLDRIIATLQCHRNEPWSSSSSTTTTIKNKNNNEKILSQESIAQQQIIPKCSCMTNERMNDIQQQDLLDNYYDYIQNNKSLSKCCHFTSKAHVEKYYCQTLRLAGVKCLNGDHLLRRTTDFFGYRNNGSIDGGYHKFIQQSLPLSLLNQRLSYDDYTKYFRFLSSKFQFKSTKENSQYQEQLILNIGLNEYELKFYTPNNLYNIAQQLDLLTTTTTTSLNDLSTYKKNQQHINHLWFNLDQLILFCNYNNNHNQNNNNNENNNKFKFAIIEDFNNIIRSIQFNRLINIYNNNNIIDQYIGNFRLVEFPPTIELLPLLIESNDKLNDNDLSNEKRKKSSNDYKNSTNSFIGIEQYVCLRLNSGTTKLPKGLKCFIEINQISSIAKSMNIANNANYIEPFEYDSNLIDVKLYSINSNNNNVVDNNELLYFILDHQLEPFETYQLNLCLRSSYRRSKLIQINGNNNNNNNIQSKLINQKFINNKNSIDQYEFKLSLRWTDTEENARCNFTLYDSFDIYPRIYTASPLLKLLQIKIRGSSRLPSDIEMYFQQPKLTIISSSSSSSSSSKDNNLKIEPIGFDNLSSTTKNNDDNDDDEFQQKLIKSNEINYIWSFDDMNNSDDKRLINSYKNFQLEFKFKSKKLNDNKNFDDKIIVNKIPYQISIQYSFQTRYTIRQWIEPLLIQNNKNIINNNNNNNNSIGGCIGSEIIRIGHSCLLRIKIERLFNNNNNNNNNPNDNDDEFIMYELICDPQLWQFIPSSNSTQQQQNDDHIDDNSSNININNNNDSMDPMSINSNQSIQSITTTTTSSSSSLSTIIKTTNEVSKVIKFNKKSIIENDNNNDQQQQKRQIFETAFEVVPLIAGYLPLPTIRLSQYHIIDNNDDDSIIVNNNNNIDDNHHQSLLINRESNNNNTIQKTTSNAIESLSTILSENLSLSGKNWSKYLTSSSSSSSSTNDNKDNNDITQQQHQQQNQSSFNSLNTLSSTTTIRNARLIPFEPGQIYNYNRSSQIYVLPSLIND